MRRPSHRQLLRSPLFALLMAALLLRALIPAGFMPVQAAEGGVQLQLCTGYAPAALLADAGRQPASTGSGAGLVDHLPCAFAATALAAPPAVSAAILQLPAPQGLPVQAGPPSRAVPAITRSQSPRAPPAAPVV